MEKFVLFVLTLFLIGFVSATCSSNQIDINTATLSQLDNLYGIGPSKAQSIIDARPYKSIDDLINAVGIGPVTLQKIKEQNLACVEDSKNNLNENNSKNNSKENNSNILALKNKTINLNSKKNSKKEKLNISNPINLTPKDIKSSKTLSSQGKSFDSRYLFLIFCIFLLGLYIIKFKKVKGKKKNEWR